MAFDPLTMIAGIVLTKLVSYTVDQDVPGPDLIGCVRSLFAQWTEKEQRLLATAMQAELATILAGQASPGQADADAAILTTQGLLHHYAPGQQQIVATFGSPRMASTFDPWQAVTTQIADDVLVAGIVRFTHDGSVHGRVDQGQRELCRRLIEAAYRGLLSDPQRRQKLLPDFAAQTAASVARIEQKQDQALHDHDETLSILRRLEADRGIPLSVLQAILRRFGEVGHLPDDPTELQLRLSAKADQYNALTVQLQGLTSDDPAVVQARTAAGLAIDQGNFREADRLLAEAVDLDLAAAAMLLEYAQTRRHSAASSLVSRADTARLQLDYRSAASFLESAARLVADIDLARSVNLLLDSAEVLQRGGEEFGEIASMRAAIALIENVEKTIAFCQVSDAEYRCILNKANVQIGLGEATADPKMIDTAIKDLLVIINDTEYFNRHILKVISSIISAIGSATGFDQDRARSTQADQLLELMNKRRIDSNSMDIVASIHHNYANTIDQRIIASFDSQGAVLSFRHRRQAVRLARRHGDQRNEALYSASMAITHDLCSGRRNTLGRMLTHLWLGEKCLERAQIVRTQERFPVDWAHDSFNRAQMLLRKADLLQDIHLAISSQKLVDQALLTIREQQWPPLWVRLRILRAYIGMTLIPKDNPDVHLRQVCADLEETRIVALQLGPKNLFVRTIDGLLTEI